MKPNARLSTRRICRNRARIGQAFRGQAFQLIASTFDVSSANGSVSLEAVFG